MSLQHSEFPGCYKVLVEVAAITGIVLYMRVLNAEAHRMLLSRVTERSQKSNGWGGRW